MAGYSEYLCLAIRYQDIEQLLAESLLASVHQEEPARKRVASLDLCGNMVRIVGHNMHKGRSLSSLGLFSVEAAAEAG